MNKTIAIVLGIAAVLGCSDPNAQKNERLYVETQSGRIKVISAQVIEDARGYSRDILVLQDSTNGVEYLAVMGAGVTEMKYVYVGKSAYLTED